MHTGVRQGLFPVFVCGSSVSAVEPAIVPRVDRTCKNQGGKCKALCGKSDDEDEGDGVHGGVFPIFVIFSVFSGSTTASEQAKPASEPRRSFSVGVAPPRPGRVRTPTLENGRVG